MIIFLGVLLIISIIMWSLVGVKLYGRHSRNVQHEADAEILLESAKAWRKDNKSFWPEICFIKPGTADLCPTGKDRDAIRDGANLVNTSYAVYVVDTQLVRGEITDNDLLSYGLSKNAFIIVSQALCYQDSELTESNGFAVVYGRETKDGIKPACV